MDFTVSPQEQQLRQAVATLCTHHARQHRPGGCDPAADRLLWEQAGRLGYLGVNIPTRYGGGGAGVQELAAVCEELAAAGFPLLLTVVSPAICATLIHHLGTPAQRDHWLPGFADGTRRMAFAATEPHAGSNLHRLATTARRNDHGWVLAGSKTFITGLDHTQSVLVVARTSGRPGSRLRPALFVVDQDTPGVRYQRLDMTVHASEHQFDLHLDQVQVPHDALLGPTDLHLGQLFTGLNPERILVAAYANGIARYALARAVEYARHRQVWATPIGHHQAISHPLARAHAAVDLARLATSRAAWLHDTHHPDEPPANGTGHTSTHAVAEAANIAKYTAVEAALEAVDTAIQTHGGNGMTDGYGLVRLWTAVRAARIAPVSRELILDFLADHALALGGPDRPTPAPTPSPTHAPGRPTRTRTSSLPPAR